MPTLIVTVGGVDSNSYETHAEANTYFDERVPIVPPWVASGQEAVLIMATRTLDALAQPFKTLFPGSGGQAAYYRIRRQWTGQAATTTQRLAWPRIGMFDRNGNAISANVIPQELKDAESELAGQLKRSDRTLDNDVVIQGLNSLRAGPVSLGFNKDIIPQVIPDAVYNLMPQSWLTDEKYESANPAMFGVVSE